MGRHTQDAVRPSVGAEWANLSSYVTINNRVHLRAMALRSMRSRGTYQPDHVAPEPATAARACWCAQCSAGMSCGVLNLGPHSLCAYCRNECHADALPAS